MKRFDARTAVLKRLKELGAYRGQVDNPMVVPICRSCFYSFYIDRMS